MSWVNDWDEWCRVQDQLLRREQRELEKERFEEMPCDTVTDGA